MSEIKELSLATTITIGVEYIFELFNLAGVVGLNENYQITNM